MERSLTNEEINALQVALSGCIGLWLVTLAQADIRCSLQNDLKLELR
jgi:hypothetical protein